MTRVLIVDDKPENLYLLSALLRGHECVVDEARHGAEALVKAHQTPPNLIISDLLMPVMDGYTLLRHWKTDERLKTIPFAVYTATYTEPKDERLALDLGADAFILKPTEPEPFMARIQKLLAKAEAKDLPPPRLPEGDSDKLLKDYGEVLIRKLEEKTLQLGQANRALREDVARRQQVEAALRQSEEEFRAMFTLASIGMAQADVRTGQWLRVNDKLCAITGYSAEELLKSRMSEITNAEDREGDWNAFQRVVRGEAPDCRIEKRYVRKDRTVVWVNVNMTVIRDAAGQPVRTIATIEDITERKRAEKRVTVLSDLGRSLSATSTRKEAAKVIMDAADELFGWDACSLVLYSPADDSEMDVFVMDTIDGKRVDVALPNINAKLTEFTRKVVMHGSQLVLRGSRPAVALPLQPFGDKSRPSASLMFVPVHHGAKIVGIMSIQSYTPNAYDEEALKTLQALGDHCAGALERKQAEEQLRQQAALLDAATDAIYVRALDHTVTYWNQGAERLYGWSRTEALGRKITELGDEGHEAFAAAHAVLLEHGNWSGELKKTSKAGKEFVVFCRWTLLRDERGQPTEVLAINSDITEKKQLESNFLRAQRQESIGALAGGIAHDLNNILAPILMSAAVLRDTVTDPESIRILAMMETCAQRGADIIKQLLTFARGKPGVRVPLPAQHLLREMEKIIRETFPRNIQPRVNTPKDLWPVLGDATQIHQALMNLSVNARDAMPDGGTLTLAAENRTLDAAFVALTPDAKPGAYVCLAVTDTGSGIPPENLDRIFDPFFTTKELGQGTGLGLATVLGIVRGHGGFVRVNSRAGSGTTFELYLPASPAAHFAPPAQNATPAPRGAGELVLVADDEAAVRGVLQGILERHGYKVIAATEGAEALALYTQRRTEVKAAITDMMMPGMDGPTLVRSLRQLEPRLPILGMTGLAERTGVKGLETLDLTVVLNKPFAARVLLNALHRALAPAVGQPPAS